MGNEQHKPQQAGKDTLESYAKRKPGVLQADELDSAEFKQDVLDYFEEKEEATLPPVLLDMEYARRQPFDWEWEVCETVPEGKLGEGTYGAVYYCWPIDHGAMKSTNARTWLRGNEDRFRTMITSPGPKFVVKKIAKKFAREWRSTLTRRQRKDLERAERKARTPQPTPDSFLADAQAMYAEWRQEIEMLYRLDEGVRQDQLAPHFARLATAYEDPHHLYIVTNAFMGGTLHKAWPALTPPERAQHGLRLVHQLILALHQLHGLNFVHCDLKPDNICLTDDITNGGTIGIIDLGAGCKGEQALNVPYGTWGWIAPESQVAPRPKSFKSDVFVMGMIIAWMLAVEGDIWDERDPTQNVTFANRTADNIVNANLKALVKGMLNPDVAARFTTQQCLQHAVFPDLTGRGPNPTHGLVYNHGAAQVHKFASHYEEMRDFVGGGDYESDNSESSADRRRRRRRERRLADLKEENKRLKRERKRLIKRMQRMLAEAQDVL